MGIRIVLITFSLLCFSNYTFSQIGWGEGYIVKHNGDTIKGLIKNKFIKLNKQQVLFKENKKKQIFTSEEIKAFGEFNGKHYRIEESISNKFVEIIISGNTKFIKANRSEFYIINSDSTYKLDIRKKRDQIIENQRNYIYERSKTLGIINYIFRDCPQDLKRTKLNESGLTKATLGYLNCSNAQYDYLKKNVPKSITILKGGYGIDLNNIRSIYLYDYTFDSEISNSFSFQMENFYPRFSKSWFINLGLIYSRRRAQDVFPNVPNDNSFGFTERMIDFNSISIPIGLGYKYDLNNKFSLYLKGGLGALFGFNIKIEDNRDVVNRDRVNLERRSAEIKSLTKSILWYSFGFNYEIKKNIVMYGEYRHTNVYGREGIEYNAAIVNPEIYKSQAIKSVIINSFQFGLSFKVL